MSSIAFKISQANRRMKERLRDHSEYEYGTGPHTGRCMGKPEPETIAEAARAYAAPRELRHVICGDPLPGRSALDRRRSGAHG